MKHSSTPRRPSTAWAGGPICWTRAALVQLNLGNNEAALADFTEANNDSPTAGRLFHLARAQYKARDRDAATRTLRKARTDFGLDPARLHPTEQEVCQTLMNELKVR